MIDVIIENGELHGKERAALRNEQLRISVANWEQRRDELLDQVAFKKGQVEILEEIIKQAYEKMLDVNKEEQQKEESLIEVRMAKLKKEEQVKEEEKRNSASLKLHKTKQKTSKGKSHPSDRARELRKRKNN